jgi:hypothetical protein
VKADCSGDTMNPNCCTFNAMGGSFTACVNNTEMLAAAMCHQ